MIVYVDACMKPQKLLCFVIGGTAILLPHSCRTHNQAEYLAITEGVYQLEEGGTACSDSELAISQINSALGRGKPYKCNNPALQECLREVLKAVEDNSFYGFETFFQWVPREKNLAGIELERRNNR